MRHGAATGQGGDDRAFWAAIIISLVLNALSRSMRLSLRFAAHYLPTKSGEVNDASVMNEPRCFVIDGATRSPWRVFVIDTQSVTNLFLKLISTPSLVSLQTLTFALT